MGFMDIRTCYGGHMPKGIGYGQGRRKAPKRKAGGNRRPFGRIVKAVKARRAKRMAGSM